MSRDIEKSISQLVQNQFPEFYRTEGELFVAFVEAYYEWMETKEFEVTLPDDTKETIDNVGAALYHSRRLNEYKDIDKTIDDFILNFKNKYLSNIQFNVATNKRLFIKNALEFYRAKGTPRAIDLFFKLVYGLEAKVYLPSDDLFRLSDNEWTNERYLELLPASTNINFVGKPVFGSVSGAQAFADKLVRVKKGSSFIEVLYLSGLSGNFITDETVFAIDDTPDSGIEFRNKIVGSLSKFKIIASDPNFAVGENLYVRDGTGKKGRAVVTAVSKAIGVVDFEFVNGGWGYSDRAEVIGSDRVLNLQDVTFTSNAYFYHNSPFEQFGLVKQDLVRYYLNESNTDSTADAFTIPNGTEVEIHAGDTESGNVVFTGVIVDKSVPNLYLDINFTRAAYSNTADGITLTDDGRELYGNSEIDFLYANTNGNTFIIDVTTSNNTAEPIDVSVEGNVIATSNTFTIQYTTSDEVTLETNEKFYQVDPVYNHTFATAELVETYIEDTLKYMTLQATRGYFRSDLTVYRTSSDAEYSINRMANVSVGMITGPLGTELNFRLLANTYAANTQLGTHAAGNANNITSTYSSEAAFRIQGYDNQESHFLYETTNADGGPLTINDIGLNNVIGNTENIDIADPGNSDIEYISTGNTIYYSNTTLETALNYTQTAIPIGEITGIVVTSPGEGYGGNPFFIVYDPLAYHAERYDYYIRYKSEGDDDLQKAYLEGEEIVVNGTDARARITKYNQQTREIYATRLHYTVDTANNVALWTSDDFRIGDTIRGLTSGISTIIETVDETRYKPRTGLNAIVDSTALSGEGFVDSIQILDSGFGYFGRKYDSATNEYIKGEDLTLASFEDDNKRISVTGYLGQNGIAPGSHPDRRSFLSSDKYIADNDFYQEYSYQVLSALPFSKYKQTLVEVLHLAGSKPFGGYLGTSEVSIDVTPTETISLYDIKKFGLFVNENIFYSANVA